MNRKREMVFNDEFEQFSCVPDYRPISIQSEK